MEYIKYFGLIIAVWFFTQGSQPIEFIKELFGVSHQDKPDNIWKRVFAKLINCSLCSGFWIGLFYYQSIELACITAIGAEIFSRLWSRFIIPL